MTKNIVGNQTTVKFEERDAACADVNPGTWLEVSCTKNVTPPVTERDTIDSSCLNDVDPKAAPGARNPRTCTFQAAWDPGDSEDVLFDLLETNQCTTHWRLENPFWTNALEFDGVIQSIVPGQITRDEIVVIDITIAVNSAVSRVA